MPAFNPHLPNNDLQLLNASVQYGNLQLHNLCQQITQIFNRITDLYQALPCRTCTLYTLTLSEAAQNACHASNPPNVGQILRCISLENIPENTATYNAMRFHRALVNGFNTIKLRSTCTATALEAARTITGDDLMIRHGHGPAVVYGSKRQAAYHPPVGEGLLRSYLGNWENFLHQREDLHPLIRMAVGHFQFISISPFTRCNVRSAHIIAQLFLVDKLQIPAPIVSLSTYWLKYRRNYEETFLNIHLRQYWHDWIEFILNAVLYQARECEQRLRSIAQVWEETHNLVIKYIPRLNNTLLSVLLMHKPYCRTSYLVDAGIAQRQTASDYLKRLCDAGLLEETIHGRSKYYVHKRLANLFEHSLLSVV